MGVLKRAVLRATLKFGRGPERVASSAALMFGRGPEKARRPTKASAVGGRQQAKPSLAKVLTEGGDLREAQVDIPLSVIHSCV